MSELAELFADLLAPENSPEIRPDSPRIRPGENGVDKGDSPDSPLSPGGTAATHSPEQAIAFEGEAFEAWAVRLKNGTEARLIQRPPVMLAELRRRFPGIAEAWPEMVKP